MRTLLKKGVPNRNKKVYYIDPYPGIAEEQILKAGENRPSLTLFTGAIGRAYQQLFEPIMSYKEEIELIEGLSIPNVKSDLRARIHDLEHSKSELEKTIKEYKDMLEMTLPANSGSHN